MTNPAIRAKKGSAIRLMDTSLSPLFENRILRRPDGATSVHLFQTLSRLCGGNHFASNRYIKELQSAIGKYQHYVLVLIDGMGTSMEDLLPGNGWFRAARRLELSSVYPSTTAVALTSLATGLWPSQHGVTGWHTRIPERGVTVLPLRATERKSGKPLKELGIPFREVVQPDSIIPGYSHRKRVFVKKALKGGQFAKWSFPGITRTGTATRTQAFDRLARHLRRSGEPSFSHLYIEELDSMSHRNGSHSLGVRSLIETFDRELTTLQDGISNQVRILVTADHGHIDVDPNRHYLLKEGDPLLDLLEAPPSGESRNPIYHVRQGCKEHFRSIFNGRFGEDFLLCTPECIEAAEVMGPGKLSGLTRNRLGTYVGVAREAAAIEYVPENGKSKGHRGMHGGLSRDEIRVPLFLG